MFWLGVILPISYIPAVTDLDILSGWIVLSLALPFLFLRPIKIGWAHWLGAAFLAFVFLSMAWTPIWQQGVWDLWLIAILAACFCLGDRDDLPSLYRGLAIGIGINSALAICQTLGWNPVFRNNSDYAPGFFFNPDMLGESAVLLCVALYTQRLYYYIPLTIPALILSHSRAAYLALGVVVVWELWRRYTWRVLLVVSLIFAGIVLDNTHKSTYASFDERKAIWLDTLSGLSPLGAGPGSFFMLYPKYAQRTDTMLTRPEDPHNDYLNLAFEFGIGSLPLLALLALGLLSRSEARPTLIAYCVIAVFSFPMRIPIEGLLGMVALGRCCQCSDLARKLSLYWGSVRAFWRLRDSGENLSLEPIHPNKGRLRRG